MRKGEVVMVTDRDEVVAEIRLPSQPMFSRVSRWIAALEEEARRGAVQLATYRQSRLVGPPEQHAAPLDAQKVLVELREDRF